MPLILLMKLFLVSIIINNNNSEYKVDRNLNVSPPGWDIDCDIVTKTNDCGSGIVIWCSWSSSQSGGGRARPANRVD